MTPAPRRIRELAADWISRREAGFSPNEEAEYQAWLAADPRHRAAAEALQPAWSAITRLRNDGRGGDLRHAVESRAARKNRRRLAVAAASLTLAAAAAITVLFFSPRPPAPGDVPSSVVLRPNTRLLPDGSTVELNFGAEIAMDFTPERRGVRLLRGEALFEVAKDAARPFVVSAGNVAVRAVGTAFTVRFDPQQVDVLVTEGRVAVEQKAGAEAGNSPKAGPADAGSNANAAAEPAPVLVSAGRRLVVPAKAAPHARATQAVSTRDVANALAWRTRRVEFNGTPLVTAVEIFNRDNALQLAVTDRAVGSLRISGVFWTNDPEAFSRVVETSLGISAAPAGERKIIFQR